MTLQVQQALVLQEKKGQLVLIDNWPKQKPAKGEILIQNVCVGLNPIDWKSIVYDFGVHSLPWINGRETAGYVVEIGEEVQGFKIGDRVFAPSTNYRDIRTSTFQTYSIAAAENVGLIPDFITFDQAAAIGVGLVTSGTAIYDSLKISMEPNSANSDKWILVWGGSSIVGIFTIQLAKYAGFKVAAVASMSNRQYLRSIGADIIFDRYDPVTSSQYAKTLGISYAIDCVGAETATYALQTLVPNGELVAIVKAPRQVPPGITVHSVLLKKFHEDLVYGNKLITFTSQLLHTKQIIPPRVEKLVGGLEKIPHGLDKLSSNLVSGRRIVVSLSE
ncbi:hypothetical protein AWJ20_2437 [Sugiyamaella lignohabitans]|uniref:Enoyl reductase (ER) domain-containing protein n=1 Tax=Sugiyamaella lignohabitans TaxID=796027 RepID=A0A167F4S8_9ASCO|nr:uncharacterized protein AWJ20_2437 [Sugiyamaella lignohabitans]ANB14825.1 hypothetical protein AWJ20_2437 [Sugiyamaella lignohabitans]